MEQDAACRYCLEPTFTADNPLLQPCACRGSQSHVHRKCLYTWIYRDPVRVQQACELCKVGYSQSLFLQFEALPALHIGSFLLRHPIVLILLTQFYVGACVDRSTADTSTALQVCSKGSHILVHAAYAGLMCLFGQVHHTAEYRAQFRRSCLAVPLLHAAVFAYASWFQQTEFFYIADFWLSAYWVAHEKVIHEVNMRLLGM